MSPYELPTLEYDYTALEPHLANEILELHHSVHHAAYVAGANAAVAALQVAREERDFRMIAGLEANLAFHLSGHFLHSLFWKNLSPEGGWEPSDALHAEITASFESFYAFKEQFTQAALSVQGSGWGCLAWDPLGARLVIEQIRDHQNNFGCGTIPLLVVDMWEHAYYLQFRSSRASWMDAFWKIVDWGDVAQRLERVRNTSIVV